MSNVWNIFHNDFLYYYLFLQLNTKGEFDLDNYMTFLRKNKMDEDSISKLEKARQCAYGINIYLFGFILTTSYKL